MTFQTQPPRDLLAFVNTQRVHLITEQALLRSMHDYSAYFINGVTENKRRIEEQVKRIHTIEKELEDALEGIVDMAAHTQR